MQLGRYETLRPIASGGMATVHLARALGAGGFERLVAVKVLHPHIASEPDFVAMFLDEARLAARVRHPNVVATIDVQEAPLFLVMDYIEGPSLQVILRELRRRKQRIPLDIALRIFVDVLAGLHAAHELLGADGEPLHLVHRDVSPHNLLVGVDGVSRITDFGVARASSRLSSTQGGQVKGKIAYMAPEQIRSEEIDRRVDIYATGAVLYESLVAQPLFRAENDGALITQIVRGVERSPRDLVPELPLNINATCMRALKLDANERYSTAADFMDAIEASAKKDGSTIASPRAVAKFVTELALHDIPSAPVSSSGSRSSPSQSSGSAGQTQLEQGSASARIETMLGPVEVDSAFGRAKKKTLLVAGAVVIGIAGIVTMFFVARSRAPEASTNSAEAAERTSATPLPTSSAQSAATTTLASSPVPNTTESAKTASSSAPGASPKPPPNVPPGGTFKLPSARPTPSPRSSGFRPESL